MAILVTGGAGYIGSVTVECLLSRGEDVVVLDNLSRGHRQALASKAIFYEGNVGDGNLLTRITKENEIESYPFCRFRVRGRIRRATKRIF